MTVSVDFSKLSYIVKNDVVKKAVYEKLAAKVNNTDTSVFALNTKYHQIEVVNETKLTELEKKIYMLVG